MREILIKQINGSGHVDTVKENTLHTSATDKFANSSLQFVEKFIDKNPTMSNTFNIPYDNINGISFMYFPKVGKLKFKLQ